MRPLTKGNANRPPDVRDQINRLKASEYYLALTNASAIRATWLFSRTLCTRRTSTPDLIASAVTAAVPQSRWSGGTRNT